MGVWDSGNFDNDEAADHILEVCIPLMDHIKETVQDDALMEPDEHDSPVMLCNIEILCNLATSLNRYSFKPQDKPEYVCEFPSSKEAEEWKVKYLNVWDNYIDGLDPDEDYKIERRKVIEETFDRFVELAKGWDKLA